MYRLIKLGNHLKSLRYYYQNFRKSIVPPLLHSKPKKPKTKKVSSDRPIFIVGCARSGTTLLAMMLHSHPRIAMPPESQFLMKLYNNRANYGDLNDPKNRAAVAASIIDHKDSKFLDLQLDKEVVRKKIIDGPPTIGSAAGIVFREYAARFGKPRWGDKRPNYVGYIDPLLALFPDAQIIHIIRDGRDCVASLKRMKWWKHPFRYSVNKWIQAIEAGNAARQKLLTDQYYELKYEDLVENPQKELRSLCQFLGEEFNKVMLEPYKIAPLAVPKRKLESHLQQLTMEEISSKAIGNWREELSKKEAALMEMMAEKQLNQYGYTPSSNQSVELSQKRIQRVTKLIEKTAVKISKYQEKDANLQRQYEQPIQALLTKGQKKMFQKS